LNDDRRRLKAATQVEPFSFSTEHRWARVLRVMDGSTLDAALMVDHKARAFKVRLAGIATPKLRPPRGDPNRQAIKREALSAKNKLSNLLPPNCLVVLQCGRFDKSGRLLVTAIWRDGGAGAQGSKDKEIIETMVTDGFALRVTSDKCPFENWKRAYESVLTRRQYRTIHRHSALQKYKKPLSMRWFNC